MTVDLSAFDRARPYVSRVLAAVVGAGGRYVARRWGAEEVLSPDLVDALSFLAAMVVYGVAHRLFDSRYNPADAAKVVTAAAGAASPIGSVSEGAAAKALDPLDVPPTEVP